MPFPDSDRIVYEKNPLNEVVCQLNFPAVLRMDLGPPIEFQEAVRSTFPIYQEEATTNVHFQVGQTEKGAVSPAVSAKKVYKFASEDNNWTVTLTRDSVALSTHAYVSWTQFQELLDRPVQALKSEYNPPFITRVGLRYINLIDREELGLSDLPWRDLLAPQIAAELTDLNVCPMIVRTASQLQFKLDEDGARIVLNHGFYPVNNAEDKFFYLIDSDFSTHRNIEVGNIYEQLKYFNNHSGKLFRWCISQRLHNELVPRPSVSSNQ